MLKSQETMLKLSELRQRINGLADTATDEERASLTGQYDALETEYRAAVKAEQLETAEHQGREDGQPAEHRALLDGASLGNYVKAALDRKPVEGREAELSAAFGLPLDSFPIHLLTDNRRIEERAIATITGDTEGNARPILGQIFPNSASAFMGIAAEDRTSGAGALSRADYRRHG